MVLQRVEAVLGSDPLAALWSLAGRVLHNADVALQLLRLVVRKEMGERVRGAVAAEIAVKAVVVLAAARELDVDGQKPGLDELQVEEEPSRSAVAVVEGGMPSKRRWNSVTTRRLCFSRSRAA